MAAGGQGHAQAHPDTQASGRVLPGAFCFLLSLAQVSLLVFTVGSGCAARVLTMGLCGARGCSLGVQAGALALSPPLAALAPSCFLSLVSPLSASPRL